MPAELLKFNTNYVNIDLDNKSVTPGNRCNGLTFFNTGNVLATIDNLIPLYPGQSYVIAGNLGEEMEQQVFNISFAPGTTPQVLVIRKVYTY